MLGLLRKWIHRNGVRAPFSPHCGSSRIDDAACFAATAAAGEGFKEPVLSKEEGRMSAFCKAAESWLNGGCHWNALDARRALQLDPAQLESLKGKVKALWGLQEYKLAAHNRVLGFRGAAAGDFSKQSLQLQEQSEAGKHDLSAFYLGGCKAEDAPEAADHVGPVEVRMTSDSRGRGLFLTADVTAGTLLFVNNAIALVKKNNEAQQQQEMQDRLGSEVVRACRNSSRTLARVNTMLEGEEEVPSMDIFRPNSRLAVEEDEGAELEIDARRIGNVVRHSTHWSSEFAGLWSLPSFINHSCLQNVSLQLVGKAMYAYAARDMASGSELLTPYTSDVFDCYRNRHRADHLGYFVCGCPRCELEKRMEQQLGEVQDRFIRAKSSLEDGTGASSSQLRTCLADMSRIAVDLERLIASPAVAGKLNEKEKHWLRASYASSYLCCYQLLGCSAKACSVVPPMQVFLQACVETWPASLVCLNIMVEAGLIDKTIARSDAFSRTFAKAIVACYGQQSHEALEALRKRL